MKSGKLNLSKTVTRDKSVSKEITRLRKEVADYSAAYTKEVGLNTQLLAKVREQGERQGKYNVILSLLATTLLEKHEGEATLDAKLALSLLNDPRDVRFVENVEAGVITLIVKEREGE